MSIPVSDILDISISIADRSVSQPSFDTVMIVTSDQSIAPDRVREYSASTWSAAMLADGFTSDSAAYRAAAAGMSQEVHVSKFKVGRRANHATQSFALTPTSSVDGVVYTVNVGSESFSYTVDSDTIAQICAALTTGINAFTAAVTAADGTTLVNLDADVAGSELEFSFEGPFTVDDNTTGADITADLNAILADDPDFYGFVLSSCVPDEVEDAAAWAESNARRFNCLNQESAPLAGTGLYQDMKDDGLTYTFPIHNPEPGDFHDFAALCKEFRFLPGTNTLRWMSLSNVSVSDYSASQQSALTADNVAFFEDLGGINVLSNGRSPSGRFMDITRFRDWLKAECQTAVANLIINAVNTTGKVPGTDAGIAMVQSTLMGVLAKAASRGAVVGPTGPKLLQYSVTFPTNAEISLADKADRILPDGQLACTYTNGIETVQMSGVISI